MSPLGHISFTLILALLMSLLFDYHFTFSQLFLILLFSNIFDLDIVVGRILGKKGEEHHNYVTHTPVGVLIMWMFFVFVLFRDMSPVFNLTILLGMFLHLVLDETQHIFFKLKLQKKTENPQINWFFPVTKPHDKDPTTGVKNSLNKHIREMPISSSLELIAIAALIIIANAMLKFGY